MFDNIGLQLCNVSENDFLRIIKQMEKELAINCDRIRFYWDGLFIQYYPNEKKMTMNNSIHKFYNGIFGAGDIGLVNHNDFSRHDLFTAASYIAETFERPMLDFKIFSKFEYGLNVDTGQVKPFAIVNRYKSCVRNAVNEFYTMPPNSGKPYCRTCFFTDYRIKAYDKSQQAKFSTKNILRYEIALHGLVMVKRVLKVREVSLLDLVLPDTWDTLFSNMMDLYDSIQKIPIGVQCSIDDLLIVHRYCDALINMDFKEFVGSVKYRAMRNIDKDVYNRLNSDEKNIHNLIRLEMKNKYACLKCGDADFSILN